MTHLSNSELQAFLRRDLAPELLLEADDHIAGCVECCVAVQREAEAERLLSLMEASFEGVARHLSYEQVRMVVEGEAVDADVKRHSAECRTCAVEVAEFRQFVAEVLATPREARPRLQLVPSPVIPRTAKPWAISPGWWGLAVAAVLIAVVGLNVTYRMRTAPPSEAVASLRDGTAELSLDRDGTLHGADGLTAESREQLRAAMMTGQLKTAEAKDLSGRRETLLSAAPSRPSESFELLSPVGRVVVDNPPVFQWAAMNGARSYRVTVYGLGYKKLMESPVVRGTEWHPDVVLPAGGTYTWTVTAESSGGIVREPAPPQPEALFSTIAADAAAEIREVREHDGADPLLLAVLYARVGAADEARAEIDQLAAANPRNALVAKLRASLVQEPSPIKLKAAQ